MDAEAAAAAAGAEERHRVGKLCETKCKKYACAIQHCLERRNHQEASCWREVGAWNSCCDRIKAWEARRREEKSQYEAAVS